MGTNAMRPFWTYKLEQNIISIEELGVAIQDNLSLEKHTNIIYGDTFMVLKKNYGWHFTS